MGVWQKVRKHKDGTEIKHWIYKFVYQGKQYKGEGHLSRSAAIRAEAAKREEVEAPLLTETPGISVQDLGTEYLNDCRRRGMQLNTIRQKAHVIRLLLLYTGSDIPAGSVTDKQAKSYMDSMLSLDPPFRPKTINRHLKDLRALYTWGMSSTINLVDHNPFLSIELFPEDAEPRYIPPPSDVAKVRAVASGIESDIIETLYYTAGRMGEIVRYRDDTGTHPITWDDINFDQRRIRLYTRKRGGRGLQVDEMYMGDALFAIMKRRWYRRDQASPYVFELTRYQVRKMMERLCETAGVRVFTAHALRHYALSILDDRGKATLRELQDFARHQRGSTTERYRHNLRDKRRTAVVLEQASGVESSEVVHNGTPKEVAKEG